VTARALLHLVGQNIRRARRSFALSVFGIAVGVASLTFFLALAAGVDRVVREVFPAGQLEVVPPSPSLEGGLGSLLSLGGARTLTDEAADELAARPEVAHAWRRARLAFPARAFGGAELFGRDLHAELIAEGVEPAAVDEATAPERFSDELGSQTPCTDDRACRAPEYCPTDTFKCERPIPAVISPFLLEIYNTAIAPSHGLPRIGGFLASRFRGFTFGVELGQSLLGQPSTGAPRQRRVMLVGVAKRAAHLALSLPLGVVRKWNALYAGERASRELSSVVLELKPGADVGRVTARIRSMGLAIADTGAERVGLALTLLTLLFTLISIAVVAVAAINIAHGFYRQVAERRREIGVLRAVGASAADVERLLLVEAAAIGLTGAALGLAFAGLAALGVNWAAVRFLPEFPFRPSSWFAFEWRILAGGVLCSVVACTAGALWPARAAARLDPAEALASP
jgi:ABC-type antimicrobial peptide transport system permease subunit